MRIAALRIENFRGVSGAQTLDLRKREGAEPASLLLLGDNGTGKSSVVDALEFVLRASLWRRIDPDRPVKRIAQNLATENRPYVEILLDDGTRLARGGPGPGRFEGSVVDVGDEVHPAFSLAPIILRRADILGFWHLPGERRKLVFLDYFTPPELGVRELAQAREMIAGLGARLPRHEKHVDWCIRQLQARLDSSTEVPRDLDALKQFRRDVLIPQYGTDTRGKYGEKLVEPGVNQRYQNLASAIEQLDRTQRRLTTEEGSLSANDGRVGGQLDAILAEAGTTLSPSFLEISGLDFVREARLESEPASNALDVRLVLADGEEADPQDVLSEAALDLLALLVYVSVIEASASHGQAKVLALDDVFQSVDAVYRSRATRYLVNQLRDWQLFVTTHDRLWFEVLASAFQSVGAPKLPMQIVRWDFESGPIVFETELDPGRSLRRALDANDPVLICAGAGVLLEEICDRLTWTLPSAVQRVRGDKYTLGPLWDSVKSKLKGSNLKAEFDEIAESMVLRNLVGAHFNDWARSVSQREAETFGSAVSDLFDAVYCRECSTWITTTPDREVWSCPGGHRRVVERATG